MANDTREGVLPAHGASADDGNEMRDPETLKRMVRMGTTMTKNLPKCGRESCLRCERWFRDNKGW
ncbi:hypothetical protein LIPSTDRAFT_71361 [Lipomyces starkeyi NRRL Y-11557]|uniref:Uncharacterized protein n=1 Tax=Lipomyces starkeyi NRRL Y-11557 TaxID=675824 RepID=A0A1E3Q640_LIPST|nr:hypothetical protein LIPSTDRAFT_71361 [Lipomyces starkeyi NRRL Y-11557]